VSNGGGNASVGWAVGSEGVVVLIAWFTYEVVYFPDLFYLVKLVCWICVSWDYTQVESSDHVIFIFMLLPVSTSCQYYTAGFSLLAKYSGYKCFHFSFFNQYISQIVQLAMELCLLYRVYFNMLF